MKRKTIFFNGLSFYIYHVKEFINGKRDIDIDYIEIVIGDIYTALEKNENFIELGYEIINDEEIKEYKLHKKEWIKTLNIFLKKAIILEEYEICSILTKLISDLEYNN